VYSIVKSVERTYFFDAYALSPSCLFPLFVSSLFTGGVFYTDANGLEWQQRRLGYRPGYSFADTNLPTNLYPMTTGQ
jgi:hypothetical protein